MSELESIFSEGRKISLGKKEVEIKGITLGDLPILLGLVSKYFEASGNNKNKDVKQIATKMLADDFESVLKLFEISTDLAKEDIKKLNLAASIIILTEVIKDNADFFSRNVAPALESLSAKVKEAGQSKSKS